MSGYEGRYEARARQNFLENQSSRLPPLWNCAGWWDWGIMTKMPGVGAHWHRIFLVYAMLVFNATIFRPIFANKMLVPSDCLFIILASPKPTSYLELCWRHYHTMAMTHFSQKLINDSGRVIKAVVTWPTYYTQSYPELVQVSCKSLQIFKLHPFNEKRFWRRLQNFSAGRHGYSIQDSRMVCNSNIGWK